MEGEGQCGPEDEGFRRGHPVCHLDHPKPEPQEEEQVCDSLSRVFGTGVYIGILCVTEPERLTCALGAMRGEVERDAERSGEKG